jgi:hypothetical protein
MIQVQSLQLQHLCFCSWLKGTAFHLGAAVATCTGVSTRLWSTSKCGSMCVAVLCYTCIWYNTVVYEDALLMGSANISCTFSRGCLPDIISLVILGCTWNRIKCSLKIHKDIPALETWCARCWFYMIKCLINGYVCQALCPHQIFWILRLRPSSIALNLQ